MAFEKRYGSLRVTVSYGLIGIRMVPGKWSSATHKKLASPTFTPVHHILVWSYNKTFISEAIREGLEHEIPAYPYRRKPKWRYVKKVQIDEVSYLKWDGAERGL